jgi:hypothetical protein
VSPVSFRLWDELNNAQLGAALRWRFVSIDRNGTDIDMMGYRGADEQFMY